MIPYPRMGKGYPGSLGKSVSTSKPTADHTPATLRYTVAFLSILAGIGYTTFDAWWQIHRLPIPVPNATGQPSLQESKFIFDLCVTFYGTVYWCGRHLYTLMGRHEGAAEVRRWSAWHMRVLNGFGGIYLLLSACQSFAQFRVIQPSVVVGLVLLFQAVIDARRARRIAGRRHPIADCAKGVRR
jgi:hypothetical protein